MHHAIPIRIRHMTSTSSVVKWLRRLHWRAGVTGSTPTRAACNFSQAIGQSTRHLLHMYVEKRQTQIECTNISLKNTSRNNEYTFTDNGHATTTTICLQGMTTFSARLKPCLRCPKITCIVYVDKGHTFNAQ